MTHYYVSDVVVAAEPEKFFWQICLAAGSQTDTKIRQIWAIFIKSVF